MIEVIDEEPIQIPEVKDEKIEEINKQLESCVLETTDNLYPINPMKSEVDLKDEGSDMKPDDYFLDSIDDESNEC